VKDGISGVPVNSALDVEKKESIRISVLGMLMKRIF